MQDPRGERWARAVRDKRTKDFWADLEDLLVDDGAEGEESPEFPPGADERPDGLSRRDFITLLGASMAFAGLSGCSNPRTPRTILPYVEQPPEVTPGRSTFYATSSVVDGHAVGLLVESREGRPIKVEGNPEHPASLGGSGVFEQASILGLYDPSRMGTLRQKTMPRTWPQLVRAFAPEGRVGKGRVHFLMEPTSSPLVIGLIRRIRRENPDARFHFFSPIETGDALGAAQAVFGRPVTPQWDLRTADVVLSIDADLLAQGPFHLRWARDFARRRRIDSPQAAMNRLYVVEPGHTPTGTMADHRLRLPPSAIVAFTRALARRVLEGKPGVPASLAASLGGPEDARWGRFAKAVAKDLERHRGRGVVVAGPRQPPQVHALVYAMNEVLGNAGRTVRYTDPAIFEAGGESHGLGALARALDAGTVDALFVLGGNPVYTAPGDLDLAARFEKAKTQVYLGLYDNETAKVCEWHVPMAHDLESWGDARAWDGTHSMVQPLIEPLYGGHTTAEVLAGFLGMEDAEPRDLLLQSWKETHAGPDAQVGFEKALRRGFEEGTTSPDAKVRMDWGGLQRLAGAASAPKAEGLELVLRVDPRIHDGRFANNPWLQELPEPVTTLTWDNAAMVSPATATRLGLEDEVVAELGVDGAKVRAPVQVTPGVADDTVILSLGYGRRGAEAVARDVGTNAYPLRTTKAPWFRDGLSLRATGSRHTLAITQSHWKLHGRGVVQKASIDAYRKNPDFTEEQRERTPTLRAAWPAEGVQWGMTVDLSLCTGCKACMVACQSENNVPVVGKVNVRKSREMHWLRVDRYFEGPVDDPQAVLQPMMCQHCERAPCEYVCPVNATAHSPDGLNEMTYNRCVGTRFCSNNCPYKVRRFNWFDFNDAKTPVEQLAMNPDVTVRARGVMEKCTYCVQRIRKAQIDAKVSKKELDATSVQSACMQACPTEAIVFGPVSDESARVSRMRAEPRAYKVLNETGTEPRTWYLARITNPNPELES